MAMREIPTGPGTSMCQLPGLQQGGRHSQFHFRAPPDDSPGAPLRDVVRAALYDDKVGLAGLNRLGEAAIADGGKKSAERFNEARKAYTELAAGIKKQIADAREEAKRTRAKLWMPNPASDAETIIDAELRAWITPIGTGKFGDPSLTPAERERAIVAMARSPVPSRAREYARELYKPLAEADPKKKDGFAKLGIHEKQIDWADEMITHMAAIANPRAAELELRSDPSLAQAAD